jgi:hypothetical protein
MPHQKLIRVLNYVWLLVVFPVAVAILVGVLGHSATLGFKTFLLMGLAQQRYVKSHRIFANSLGVKDFRPIRNSHDGTCFSRSVLGA